MTPKEFAAKINEWARGTLIASHGTQFLTAGEGRAREFRPELNTDSGTLTAEAEVIQRGRTKLVVDGQVVDDERRLVAKLLATQLASRSGAGRG
jgi:hypothetical protein